MSNNDFRDRGLPTFDSASRRIGHGAGCDCRYLAAAAHGGDQAVPFSYCHNILQKRYRMTCRHGEAEPTVEAKISSERWHDRDAIDAVKAILVKNT